VKAGKEARKTAKAAPGPGADDGFHMTEQKLKEQGYARHPWETIIRWIERIESGGDEIFKKNGLRAIAGMYYKRRFDPDGLTLEEEKDMEASVRSWLEKAGAGGGDNQLSPSSISNSKSHT